MDKGLLIFGRNLEIQTIVHCTTTLCSQPIGLDDQGHSSRTQSYKSQVSCSIFSSLAACHEIWHKPNLLNLEHLLLCPPSSLGLTIKHGIHLIFLILIICCLCTFFFVLLMGIALKWIHNKNHCS